MSEPLEYLRFASEHDLYDYDQTLNAVSYIEQLEKENAELIKKLEMLIAELMQVVESNNQPK